MDTYTVMIHGLPHTMQLDEDDAKRFGAVRVDSKAATPLNKAVEAENK